MQNNLVNLVINTKKGLSPRWPFDDPNYVPRVIRTTRQKVRSDGTTKEVEYKYFTTPLSTLDRKTLEDMGRLPHQTMVGVPNPNNISHRKNPRIVNNSPKYKTIRGKRKQVRPIPIKVLSKEAVANLKLGNKHLVINEKGKLIPGNTVTRLRTPKHINDKTFGFNKSKNN